MNQIDTSMSGHSCLGGRRLKGDQKQASVHLPLVSIVTVVRNRVDSIEKTFQSVFAQSYPHIEYVVIDGASTDGTLDIIKQYDNKIDYWISEPDRGISDAFNKGIKAASGDYIKLLNADDWIEPQYCQNAVSLFNEVPCDYLFGNLRMYDRAGKIKYIQNGQPDYQCEIHRTMPHMNHPSMIVKRTLYEKVGQFDLSCRVAMDYDWLLRSHQMGYYGYYSDSLTANVRLTGVSHQGFIDGYREVRDISIKYGYGKYKAWFWYFIKTFKSCLRLCLEKIMPAKWVARLRKIQNRRYDSAE